MAKSKNISGLRRIPFNREGLERAISDWKARQEDGYGTQDILRETLREEFKAEADADRSTALSWFEDARRNGLATAANLRRLEKFFALAYGALDAVDSPEKAVVGPATQLQAPAVAPQQGAGTATTPVPPVPGAAPIAAGLAQSINPLTALGFFVLLATFLIALWLILPLKLNLPWAVMLAAVGAAAGSLIWHPVVLLLKKHGLESMDTDSFGGRNEVQLFGGIALGPSYYLPLAVLLAMVDVNSHGLDWSAAAWANGAFLLGTAAGGAVFHGMRLRQRSYALGWSHLKQESVLVVLWSGLLFGAGFLPYAAAAALSTASPLFAAICNALLITLFPIVLCLCAVFLFIAVCVTPQNLREDVRGAINGIMSMFAVTLAHEMYWRLHG